MSNILNWKTVSLFDICSPKQWPTISQSEFTETGFPVYGANGRVGFYTEYNHENPTVLITCRGATCGTINVCDPKSYVTGNSMALDELDKQVCLRFLVYSLQLDGLNKAITGTAQPQITRESLKSVRLTLPPLSEQKRIASILDRAEALRAKRRAALALLDELTQSIFLDMFGDPVSNPKGFEIRMFSDLGTLDRGISKNRPRNSPHLLGGTHPLIQTGDIANCGGYIRKHVGTYSDAGLVQSKKWPAGTLCITIAANIAKTGILTFDACFPDSVVGFKSDPATVEYARVWLSFLQKALEDAAPESAQKNINLATLRSLPVPTPPIDLRAEFASRINAAEELKSIEKFAFEELDHLFASLQHRAFRGEL